MIHHQRCDGDWDPPAPPCVLAATAVSRPSAREGGLPPPLPARPVRPRSHSPNPGNNQPTSRLEGSEFTLFFGFEQFRTVILPDRTATPCVWLTRRSAVADVSDMGLADPTSI